MAKAKTKAKGGKKAAKKTGERNATPKLKSCPFEANLTRPHTTESSGKQATSLAEFMSAKESWIGEVRKTFADNAKRSSGTKAAALPEFPVKAFFDPNKGQLSRKAHDALVDEHTDAVEAGTKPPALYGRYSPVTVDAIHAMNCISLRRGSPAKHPKPPKDWDEKAYGNWWHEWDEDGETVQEASGWFFDKKMPRPCHANRAESLIDNPDENILTFGNLRIVCGTGTHDGSAVFIVNQTSHGNYRAGDITRKRLSHPSSNKDIRNIVFKIEDRPNNEGGFTVKGKWAAVREMVYMPGQVLTAGYLFDKGGNQLDAKAIRALDSGTKSLRFKALEAPIVGKAVPWSKLWAEIRIVDKASIKKMRERGGRSDEFEAGDVETKAITNIRVNGVRLDPSEAFPFALRGSQCNMPAFLVADGEGKIEDGHFGMGVVIGARANHEYCVGVHKAKGETEEVEEVEEAPAPKPKAAKKATPKAAKKATKATKADPKPKPTDAAPPVEADTADEGDTAVEAEETVASE